MSIRIKQYQDLNYASVKIVVDIEQDGRVVKSFYKFSDLDAEERTVRDAVRWLKDVWQHNAEHVWVRQFKGNTPYWKKRSIDDFLS